MSWSEFHAKSEELAALAEIAARQGETDRYVKLYKEAGEAEVQAINALDTNKSRTLGITALSAASLFYKARAYWRAEQIAYQWLGSGLLPQFAIAQLRSLLGTIWDEQTVRSEANEDFYRISGYQHLPATMQMIQFDFPSEYHDTGSMSTIKVDLSEGEEMYGLLDTPKQGYPLIRQYPTPEQDHLSIAPLNDQVFEIDHPIIFEHTGRLHGSLLKYLARSECKSKIKMYAAPISVAGDNTGSVLLGLIETPLTPAPKGPNIWFWKDLVTMDELVFRAQLMVSPREVGLQAGIVYRLVVRWEFLDESVSPPKRLPISGFNASVVFEVISETFR